ncbi:hypothetical protein KDL45_06000 [bacterium]|nr:hypothetical protein [bacterium]
MQAFVSVEGAHSCDKVKYIQVGQGQTLDDNDPPLVKENRTYAAKESPGSEFDKLERKFSQSIGNDDSSEAARQYFGMIALEFPEKTTKVFRGYLEQEIKGEKPYKKLHEFRDYYLKILADRASAGDDEAYFYLQLGAKKTYWYSMHNNWNFTGVSAAGTKSLMRNAFLRALAEVENRNVIEFFQKIYKESTKQGDLPNGVVDEAIWRILYKRHAKSEGLQFDYDAAVAAFLSDELPGKMRCIPYFHDEAPYHSRFNRILKDQAYQGAWKYAVIGFGNSAISRSETFQYLKYFLEKRFEGEISQDTFHAISNAPLGLAPLYLFGAEREVFEYYKNATSMQYWESIDIKWTHKDIKGKRRSLYLTQLFIKYLPLLYEGKSGENPQEIYEDVKFSRWWVLNERYVLHSSISRANDFNNRYSLNACKWMLHKLNSSIEDYWNYPY